MTLLFHDPINQRWQGVDPAEMRAIFSRLATDEEARETFGDITGLEVINR